MIKIRKPNDFHHHMREGSILEMTTKECFDKFYHVVVMPNLKVPVTSIKQALDYRKEIKSYDTRGNPMMTLYLNDKISLSDLEKFKTYPELIGIKYYPKSATTNSEFGILKIESIFHILEKMEEYGIPLLVHGESIQHGVDIFDRENVFVQNELLTIIKKYPKLKIILEHISKKESVDFVIKHNIFATITPQHLLLDRNDIFKCGINPHLYCLPILKRSTDRLALLEAALSGRKNFFLGTDSAPHLEVKKLSSCGCAGIFNSPVAVELITEIFDTHDCLDKLEGFISTNGCDCYGLPYNEEYITLKKENWVVPDKYWGVVPLYNGKTVHWTYT